MAGTIQISPHQTWSHILSNSFENQKAENFPTLEKKKVELSELEVIWKSDEEATDIEYALNKFQDTNFYKIKWKQFSIFCWNKILDPQLYWNLYLSLVDLVSELKLLHWTGSVSILLGLIYWATCCVEQQFVQNVGVLGQYRSWTWWVFMSSISTELLVVLRSKILQFCISIDFCLGGFSWNENVVDFDFSHISVQ